MAQAGIDFTNEMFTGFEGMLPTAADGPQECLLPMAMEFRSLIFEGMSLIPSYTEWLLQCDMEPAYRYHRRVLKLLQWRCPPDRWWLKSPAHMLSIDALDAVYPDARFVMTHRDVGQVLPSVCALYSTLSTILTERPDPEAIGAHASRCGGSALERLIAFRDRGNEDRFFDLSFDAVQRDPLGEVARLYAAAGRRPERRGPPAHGGLVDPELGAPTGTRERHARDLRARSGRRRRAVRVLRRAVRHSGDPLTTT